MQAPFLKPQGHLPTAAEPTHRKLVNLLAAGGKGRVVGHLVKELLLIDRMVNIEQAPVGGNGRLHVHLDVGHDAHQLTRGTAHLHSSGQGLVG